MKRLPLDAAPRILTAGDFDIWLHAAAAGEACCYHRGDLASDRDDDQRVTDLGRAARLAGEAGLVHLVQRQAPKYGPAAGALTGYYAIKRAG